MDDKVYTNETIPDAPFPNQPDNTTVTDSTPSSSNTKAAGQTTIPQQGFIQKNIAVETESQAFNTRTKKIIQEFQFTPSGAIQIGDFKAGISGDLRISPNGIIARNAVGDPTFALDGDTGDAVFKGIVKASGFNIIDDQGIISTSVFTTNSISNNGLHVTSSASYVDISGSILQPITLTRPTNILFFLDVSGANSAMSTDGSVMQVQVLDTVTNNLILDIIVTGIYAGATVGIKAETVTRLEVVQLEAGLHAFKLQHRIIGTGNGSIGTFDYGFLQLAS